MNTVTKVYKSFQVYKAKNEYVKNVMMEMPYVYALFSSLVSSGATIYDSIRILSMASPPLSRIYFANSLAHLENGMTFAESVENMYRSDKMRPLARVMLEIYESGVSGEEALDRLHKDSINQISRQANTEIKKLTVKMLFPLVICILPAFVLLSVLPVLLNGLMNIQL